MIEIREAMPADSARIAEIWNKTIRESLATFNSVEKTPCDVSDLLSTRSGCAGSFLVADAGGVKGFATYGQFRGGVGYRWTAEHTIVLAPSARRMGIGSSLMTALEQIARQNGVHSMIAGISAENPSAVTFHASIGFRQIARLPEVGFKFGRWLDLILMQKFM